MPVALPSPPSSVVVTDVSADSVSLSWNSGNVEPVSSYVVQFRAKYTDGEEAEWRESADVVRTSLTVRGLRAFSVYELRVLAVSSIGRSLPSAGVDVTTAELRQSRPHTQQSRRGQGHGGGNCTPPIVACRKISILSKNFLLKT